ncbi:MAG: SpoIIE family protein phosphatase [Gammaproteobacteria bacterium]|nr:SpoIIE family protein phosphatase [Gammaproteobacteria bacterium]
MTSDTPNQNPILGQGETKTLGILSSLFEEFSRSLDLDQTMQKVVEVTKAMMSAEGVALFLLENADTELVCRVCSTPTDITGMRISARQGIIGRSIRREKVQLVADASTDPDFVRGVDGMAGSQVRSIVCAPLTLGGKSFGALQAMNKTAYGERFDEKDQNFLSTLANAASLAIHNAKLVSQVLDEERTRQELSLAREIQEAVFPDARQGGHVIAGYNLSARSVSGDFYDYLEVSPGRFCFCLGDVSGKGVNAALMVARVSGLFRYLAKSKTSPAELLAAMNTELCETMTRGMFVTMVAGVYERKDKMIEMANAGHHPPLQMQANNIIAYEQASPPLGVLPDIAFEPYVLRLKDGALYIFTDGLTECWTDHQQPLGNDGVKALIRKHATVPLTERLKVIVEDATQWKMKTGGYLNDDITLLVIDG